MLAGAAVDALAADRGRGLGDDAVAFLEPAHASAETRDRAPELVAEHDRHVDGPALLVVVLVHVAAAHAHGAHAQEDVLFAELRHRQLAQLDRLRLQGVLHEARHRVASCADPPRDLR